MLHLTQLQFSPLSLSQPITYTLHHVPTSVSPQKRAELLGMAYKLPHPNMA